MTRITSGGGKDPDDPEDMVVNIRIVLANKEGAKPSSNNFMGVGTNPERDNTSGH